MSSIVIALPKIEDARKIRAVLERHGFTVASVCTTASNALSSASELGSGVIILIFQSACREILKCCFLRLRE